MGSEVQLNCLHCITLKRFLNTTLNFQRDTYLSHLWSGSKINDSIQFKALSKLLIHPVMPVLINCPLCFIHTIRFIQIRCKNIPERETTSTHKFFPKSTEKQKRQNRSTKWTWNLPRRPVLDTALDSRKNNTLSSTTGSYVLGQWFSKMWCKDPW